MLPLSTEQLFFPAEIVLSRTSEFSVQEHLRATLLQNRSQWLVSRLLLFHGNPKKDNNNNNNKASDITIINKKPKNSDK